MRYDTRNALYKGCNCPLKMLRSTNCFDEYESFLLNSERERVSEGGSGGVGGEASTSRIRKINASTSLSFDSWR